MFIVNLYTLQPIDFLNLVDQVFLQRVKVEDPADTNFLEGDQVDKHRILENNASISTMIVVTEPGDTRFKENDLVKKFEIERINERLQNQKKDIVKYRAARPATFYPLLLGITQASLSTDSFISA